MGFVLVLFGLETENCGAVGHFGLTVHHYIHVPEPRLAQTHVLLDRPVFLVIFCITLLPQKLEKEIKNEKKINTCNLLSFL